jgi:hypothetical protein
VRLETADVDRTEAVVFAVAVEECEDAVEIWDVVAFEVVEVLAVVALGTSMAVGSRFSKMAMLNGRDGVENGVKAVGMQSPS